MKRLILASGSSARKDILQNAGVKFNVDVSNYEEDMTLAKEPTELAKFLSKGKARAVAKRHKDAIVLSADSFAEFQGQLFGKPHTTANARKFLKIFSGQCHLFMTGFTIIDVDTLKEYSEAVVTKVYFRHLTDKEISNYISRENVLNNAGAYKIQNLGGALVDKVEGDYLNVMGLPLSKIVIALRDFGISLI